MMKKTIAGLAAITAIAVAGYYAWAWYAGTSTETTAQETAVVRREALTVTVETTGSLAPATELALSFATAGRVAEVRAALGDAVEAGQVLAVLDTQDLALQLAAAENSRDSASIGLASASRSLADLEDGPSAVELETAKIQLEKAKDSRWGVQAQRDATCGRVEKGRGEQVECDSAEAAVLGAEDGVRLAELQYQDVLDGASAAEIADAQDKVKQARAQLASAEVQVAQARLKLEQATLTAPRAGTIIAAAIEVGQQAGTAAAAFTLGDLSSLEVEVLLDQNDIGAIVVGQPATVTVSAFADTRIDGEVTRIAPVAETASGVVLYPVTVALKPTDVAVRPGMTADVSIIAMHRPDVLIIPRQALQAEAGRQYVDVAEAGDAAAARQVDVTVGAITETAVEIVSGLAEGDVVVVPAARERTSSGGFGGPLMGGPPP